jgi:uncharacterized MAPEG superfamily protein
MTALNALVLFAALTLLMSLAYALPRVPQVLLGNRKADAWTRGNVVADPAILTRAHHAHLNCLEGLPPFAAIVLAAAALGQMQVADSVAAYILYARVGQIVVHLLGTSFLLVLARATFFFIQVALMLYIASGLVSGL